MDKAERTSSRNKKTPGKSPSKKGLNLNGKNKDTKDTTVVASNNSLADDDSDMVVEDENTWECSVCTYRNSQETFKCLMCDVCKGTSTRKPRYNHDLVAQKVKKQQIQIHQKLLKSSKHHSLVPNDTRDSSDLNSKDNLDKVTETRESKFKDNKDGKLSGDDHLAEKKSYQQHHHHYGKESKAWEPKDEAKDGKETRVKGGKSGKISKQQQSSNESIEETAGPSVNCNSSYSQNESSTSPNHHKSSDYNSSSSSASSKTTNINGSPSTNDNNNNNYSSTKLTTKSPGKLVKSNSKSSIMKMKNIDRNNFLAQAVTVNNVTVIITEFQLKKKMKATTPTTKKSNQRQSSVTKDKD